MEALQLADFIQGLPASAFLAGSRLAAAGQLHGADGHAEPSGLDRDACPGELVAGFGDGPAVRPPGHRAAFSGGSPQAARGPGSSVSDARNDAIASTTEALLIAAVGAAAGVGCEGDEPAVGVRGLDADGAAGDDPSAVRADTSRPFLLSHRRVTSSAPLRQLRCGRLDMT